MYKHRDTEESVREFHLAMGAAVDETFKVGKESLSLLGLRCSLMVEEMRAVDEAAVELGQALFQKRGPEFVRDKKSAFLKELCDLQYVLDGTFVAFGLPKVPAFNRVHKSNMSKLEDDYTAPNFDNLWEKL